MLADKYAFRKCTCWCFTSTPREILQVTCNKSLCFSTQQRFRKCTCWCFTSTPREILQVTGNKSLCFSIPQRFRTCTCWCFTSTPRGLSRVTCDESVCFSIPQRFRQSTCWCVASIPGWSIGTVNDALETCGEWRAKDMWCNKNSHWNCKPVGPKYMGHLD